MRGELQLTLLGNPRLEKEGAAVTGITHRKSLAVTAYLAVTGRAHSRDVLAGLSLGRSTQANARAGPRKLPYSFTRMYRTTTREPFAYRT